ncbi:hypothetical protein PYW07_012490 [Mythimna separata]|uniref:U6 snRNA-specific terminal uridylyltransferase 1 n=1 Tax=Mythimna separata TaxID=271217 RepID=A0AAD8DSJ8_MYTSE|nr:hypothetical protein PYW07_012490 [Mythimna separata]
MDNSTLVQPSTPSPSSSSPRHSARRRRGERPDARPEVHPQVRPEPRPDAQPQPRPDAQPMRRIIVTGYPNYTQPQDLLDAFSPFGVVRIDKCNAWMATLSFVRAEAAAAAAGAARLHIYGHYLTVRPYSSKLATELSQPTTPKRDFPMSKQKGIIVEPKKINLTGDFHSQLDNILSAVRLTQEDVKCLGLLYTDLESALQSLWPGCKAVPFGSITTGLGIKTSDADCFINIPAQFRAPHCNYVNKAKRLLMNYGGSFAEILAIPRANTPIVKFYHTRTHTNCDVTFKTPLGAQNSRLIAFLLHSDPRLLPMAVLIKYWAKVHDLTGTGKLTNYALTMMIIFYLQQPPHSILPPVAWLQRDQAHAYIVDHWNTGFMNNPALLPAHSNTSSIAELLGGFFEYYSLFNFEEMAICTYLGVPVKKELFKETASMPDEFDRYKKNVLNNYVMPIRNQTAFVVQDPFEQCHNVASTVTGKLAVDIKTYFKFCANAYEKEKLNSCQDFLKIILLQRPKLIRGKTHPEFRVNLFPRMINPIISYDWKSVVRDMVKEIFENMLKIQLGKIEEKVNPDTRKEKEKYSGTLTKPIWKRKVFTKLYNVMNMSFEEKQARITQEIINTDKQDINIPFQLTLTFCHDPKSAVISVRLGSGDLDAFREFGKFFISVTQNWLTELLKPFSMPNCKDTATKIAETMEDNNENGMDSDDDDDSEIVLVPKSDTSAATTPTDDVERTSTSAEQTVGQTDTAVNSLGQTLESTSLIETKKTNAMLTVIEGIVHKSPEILTNHTNNVLMKYSEIVTDSTDLNVTKKPAILTNNTAETSSKKAETLTKNVENFFKNAESLLASDALSASATGVPQPARADVTPPARAGDVTQLARSTDVTCQTK